MNSVVIRFIQTCLIRATVCVAVLLAAFPVKIAASEAGLAEFPAEAAANQLNTYYDEGEVKAFPWYEAAKATASNDPAVARRGGEYLLAILRQAQQDELSGAAPWRPTPFWGSNGENPARKIRELILWNVAPREIDKENPAPPGQIPLLEWFVLKEKVVQFQLEALSSLDRFEPAIIRPLVQSSAGDLKLGHMVRTAAFKLGLAKGIKFSEELLRSAFGSYHESLREAAGACWKEQFKTEVPALFDPAEAVKSPQVAVLIGKIGAYLVNPPESNAAFVALDDLGSGDDRTVRGWVLSRSGVRIRILTPYGRVIDHPVEAEKDDVGGQKQIRIKEVPIADYVAELEKLRRGGDEEHELSEHGSLSGQFEGSVAGLPEFILAYMLYERNEWEACARILFPALSTCVSEERAMYLVRSQLGIARGHRMLVEFVGNRDYAEAVKQAKLIIKHLPGTIFAELASRMVRELPERTDDFKALALPTPAEWENWKAKHTRAEQVDYLCVRLRLLNCYQYGQPGDVDLFDMQTREPTGLGDFAAYPLGLGKTEVINPIVVLLGGEVYDEEKDEKETVPGMDLNILDVPVIAPYLKEDWLILSVGYWRSHYPTRTVISTRELVGWILKRAAGREVFDDRKARGMSDEEIARKAREISEWAEERKNWSEGQLLLEYLGTLKESGAPWADACDASERLAGLGEKEAFPLVAGWLGHEDTDSYELPGIIENLRILDAEKAKPLVREFLKHEDPDVQIEAACVFLAAGDEKEGCAALGEAFSRVDHSNIGDWALRGKVEFVVRHDTPQGWKALARLFDDIGVFTISSFNLAGVCRELERKGNSAGLQFYTNLLGNRETGIPNKVSWGRPIAFMAGDHLLREYAEHDSMAAGIQESSKSDTEERLAAVEAWLAGRLEHLKKSQEKGAAD